jgi:hypothetical protein
LTLRIKRVYFDAIKRGEKTYELRSDTEYYRSRLQGKDYTTIMLHYQRPQRVYAKVVSIERVRTPAGIDTKVISTPWCWKINLSNPRFRMESK